MSRNDPADAGFTLIEVLASLAVIGVVLAAATTFFVRSMVVINLQGAKQAAIQLAASNLEQLRALSGPNALNWLITNAAAGDSPAGTVGSIDYRQVWTCTEDGGATCTASTLNTLTSRALFVGATVQITWTSQDCMTNLCSYRTATRLSLTSAAVGEPQFGSS
jgi:prepilin-type N-terminal cleavage/methylation domain-containing protein